MKSIEFSVEEIVWAKFGRYPWWPALIKSIKKKSTKNYELIFLGDFSRGFLSKSKIKKWTEIAIKKNIRRKNREYNRGQ